MLLLSRLIPKPSTRSSARARWTPCSRCSPGDGMGRLMGKRVAPVLPRPRAGDGVHACIYLFTVDMEMEPLPGFTLTSWERGYGDMKMVRIWGRGGSCPGSPRRPSSSGRLTEEGSPSEEAPRWVLKRQLAREAGAASREDGLRARACISSAILRTRRARKRYQGLTPVWATSGLPHPPDDQGRALVRAIRNGMEAARVPWSSPRGSGARGRRRSTSRYAEALEMADPMCSTSTAPRRSAWQQGGSITFMAKYDMGRRARPVISILECGQGGRRNLFAGRGRQGTPLFQQWLPGQIHGARVLVLLRAHHSMPTSATGGLLRPHAHRGGWDNRTCGFASAARAPLPGGEIAVPGADANPYLPLPRRSPRVPRDRQEAQAAQALRRQRLRGSQSWCRSRRPSEALDALERSGRPGALGATVVKHYLHHGVSSSRPSTGRHRLGAHAALRAHLSTLTLDLERRGEMMRGKRRPGATTDSPEGRARPQAAWSSRPDHPPQPEQLPGP